MAIKFSCLSNSNVTQRMVRLHVHALCNCTKIVCLQCALLSTDKLQCLWKARLMCVMCYLPFNIIFTACIFIVVIILFYRRLKQDLTTIYKMFHGLIDVRVNKFFQVKTVNITRGHNYKIIKPVCNNNARQFSFSCRRINCWNSLTQTTVNAHSVAAFKHYLNSVNFSKYLHVLN